jgi:hypothetical protein
MMSRKLRQFIASLLLLSFLLMYVPLVSAVGGSLGDHGTSAQQRKAAMKAVAEFLTGRTDLSGKMLQKFCYEPSIALLTWQGFPAIRKIATAYEAAEAANPGIGGDKLLALLSQSLAQQYEAARYERSLSSYLKMRVNKQRCLEFRNEEKRVFLSDLPYETRNAITTIADYSTRGPLGSPQSVIRFLLRDNPNYTESDADGFLCQSDTVADAMLRAASFVPAQVLDARLRELTSRLIPHYEAARYEPSLKPYMPLTEDINPLTTSVRPRTTEPPPNTDFGFGIQLNRPYEPPPSARPRAPIPYPNNGSDMSKQIRKAPKKSERVREPVTQSPRTTAVPREYRPLGIPDKPIILRPQPPAANTRPAPQRPGRSVLVQPPPPAPVRRYELPRTTHPTQTRPSSPLRQAPIKPGGVCP